MHRTRSVPITEHIGGAVDDVWEQAKVEAAKLTDRELRCGFRAACGQYEDAVVVGDFVAAKFALWCCDCTLDVWNERHLR